MNAASGSGLNQGAQGHGEHEAVFDDGDGGHGELEHGPKTGAANSPFGQHRPQHPEDLAGAAHRGAVQQSLVGPAGDDLPHIVQATLELVGAQPRLEEVARDFSGRISIAMDGFEVATLVRHDERMKDLPIIMITSRTGEKHRQRAMAIGVNEYLGKPYQESLLLETINRLVKAHD